MANSRKPLSPGPEAPPPAFSSVAWSTSVDMLASIIVGSGLGWCLDSWLGCKPWGLIGGFILGSASGLWTTYKKLCRMGCGLGTKNHVESPK